MLVRKVQDRKNAIPREDAYDGGMCVMGGGVGWGGGDVCDGVGRGCLRWEDAYDGGCI